MDLLIRFKWMWRRRKQTQNCAALPSLSTRADILKCVNHRNLRCSALRGLRCLRLNARPALGAFEKIAKGSYQVRHFCLSIRPSALNNAAPSGRIFMKFDI